MAEPMAVPLSLTVPRLPESLRRRSVRLLRSHWWSRVMGLADTGRPAKATSPMRSSGRRVMNSSMTRLAASMRLMVPPL